MGDPAVIVAAFGALGTIISAWLVYRVQMVQRSVNGHTEDLQQRIDALQEQVRMTSLKVIPPADEELIHR